MKQLDVDILIIGAGPVGLMCAYLGHLCGLKVLAVDKSDGPLQVGRADALNARSLQLLDVVDLFDDLYPLGKPCNTSSVWKNGEFVSRQSSWWDALEGCFHKHFLMLGQAFVEQLVDEKLSALSAPVRRSTSIETLDIDSDSCVCMFTDGTSVRSRYVIGADGSKSYVRQRFDIPFEIVRPQIIWAVIDGVLETDFPKVPEIIVFQAETSDVAWIPREGDIDRFYIRMDTKNFTMEQAIEKINRAMSPHSLAFKEVVWFSQFSVKESVAQRFFVEDRVFLAGDACHIHSVNGGQGLNTGLADAFNLMWKLNMVIQHRASNELLEQYQSERQPVARSVIESSGELVRSTKYSETGTHAEDYVKIVEKRAGNITGMGIHYPSDRDSVVGTRVFDFGIYVDGRQTRLYQLLDYSKYTLLMVGDCRAPENLPEFIQVIRIVTEKSDSDMWTDSAVYASRLVLIRPDAYIDAIATFDEFDNILNRIDDLLMCCSGR